MTKPEMIKIMDSGTIDECTPGEREEVMNFAFGEKFMKSNNKGKKVTYDRL